MSSFEFGWGAPPMKEQFPELSEEISDHFDKDNEALTRLRIRGYLSDSARNSVLKKVGKAISKSLKEATNADR